MTFIELAQKVLADHQALSFKVNEDNTVSVKEYYDAKGKGWVMLDATTASAVMAIYNGLNEVNKAKFLTLHPLKIVDVCWKLVK